MTVVDLSEARRRKLNCGELWLNKRELAAHLGRSVRWVEYRLAEGMPHKTFGGMRRMQPTTAAEWLSRPHSNRETDE